MKTDIGARIRSLRLQKSMTQEQLAQKLNLTPQAVSKWENGVGMPDIQLLPELSTLLGVTAFSSLWSILELFKQRKRVEKGWFPVNPKRKSRQ